MPFKDSKKAKEYKAKWYLENRERVSEMKKTDRQDNPDKYTTQEQRRYGRDKEKRKAYQKQLRTDPEKRAKLNEAAKEYYNENKDVINRKSRENRIANRTKVLEYEYNYQLNRKYGIDLTEYNNMLIAQSNKCAICSVSYDEERLAVDHCHDSGKIRGLLCMKCNTALGSFKDSIDILQNAINYLKK